MAQVVDNSPEAVIRELRETVRQLRMQATSESSSYRAGALAGLVTDGAWRPDPEMACDVLVRINGVLRVDVGADLDPAGGITARYAYAVVTTEDIGGGETAETIVRAADVGHAVSATGFTLGASRSSRIAGLDPGYYRVRGYYLATGATSIANRSIIAAAR